MNEKNFTEITFNLLNEYDEDNFSIRQISVLCKIRPMQSLSAGGITLMLLLKNNFSGDQAIMNPLDYLKISLHDEEGWPLKLPLSPNRTMMNPGTEGKIVRSFEVIKVENTKGETNLKEQLVDAKHILLKADTSYQFEIQINKIQDSDKRNIFLQTEKTIPITQGKYKLKFNMSIMLATDANIFKQFESTFVEIELI